MGISRPSYQLAAGTHVISTNAGALTFVSAIADGTNDVTVDCHDASAAGDIATTNQIVTFKIDTSLNGFQGGGNITHPIKFINGLVVKVTGTNGVAYVAHTK